MALKKYTNILPIGFDVNRWLQLCENLDKKDPDPKAPFRDEQRAWYDTLRDFVPFFLNIKPTKRLYVSDYVWCSLEATKREDLETFKTLIGE